MRACVKCVHAWLWRGHMSLQNSCCLRFFVFFETFNLNQFRVCVCFLCIA